METMVQTADAGTCNAGSIFDSVWPFSLMIVCAFLVKGYKKRSCWVFACDVTKQIAARALLHFLNMKITMSLFKWLKEEQLSSVSHCGENGEMGEDEDKMEKMLHGLVDGAIQRFEVLEDKREKTFHRCVEERLPNILEDKLENMLDRYVESIQRREDSWEERLPRILEEREKKNEVKINSKMQESEKRTLDEIDKISKTFEEQDEKLQMMQSKIDELGTTTMSETDNMEEPQLWEGESMDPDTDDDILFDCVWKPHIQNVSHSVPTSCPINTRNVQAPLVSPSLETNLCATRLVPSSNLPPVYVFGDFMQPGSNHGCSSGIWQPGLTHGCSSGIDSMYSNTEGMMVQSAEEGSSNTMSESESAENLLPKRETSKYMSDADLKRADKIFEELPADKYDKDPETLHYNNLRHWAKISLITRFQARTIELDLFVPHHLLQSARTRLRTELLEKLADLATEKKKTSLQVVVPLLEGLDGH